MADRRVIEPIVRVRRAERWGQKSYMGTGFSTIARGTINSFWSVAINWRISRDIGLRRALRKGRPTNVLGEPGLNMLRRLELANDRNNTMMMEGDTLTDEVTRELERIERTDHPWDRAKRIDYAFNDWWIARGSPAPHSDLWTFERDWAEASSEQRPRRKVKGSR